MRRLLLLLAFMLAAYVGYPYLTMYWIDRALLTDDKAALERLVDFPKVQADLKGEVQGQVVGKADEFAQKRPILGAFGQMLAQPPACWTAPWTAWSPRTQSSEVRPWSSIANATNPSPISSLTPSSPPRPASPST